MKKETRKKSAALVKSGGEAQSYTAWIADLKRRYRATQIKAAVAVNSALIEFYWNLGKDITEKFAEEAGYGSRFFEKVSFDMRTEFPNDTGFSPRNIRYCQDFYCLYSSMQILQQVVAKSAKGKRAASKMPQVAAKYVRSQLVDDKILQQLVAQLVSVPWGHHCVIIDKCKRNRDKALFYVRRTIQNGWSRNSLLNWLSTDLYEREGKAQTNFDLTMPSDDCDLARQLVKDPQKFEVFGLSEEYSEKELKAAIVANIESTLLSFGKGVAFLGKEYPVEVGGETKNIDLLFYIVPLHRYLVVEVKTGKYEPADLGQLSGYMAIAKHVLNTPVDNQPVGLLICREHNRVLAKYHLEELGLPMGISDYELKKVLPTKAQLAKCVTDAERQIAEASMARHTNPSNLETGR